MSLHIRIEDRNFKAASVLKIMWRESGFETLSWWRYILLVGALAATPVVLFSIFLVAVGEFQFRQGALVTDWRLSSPRLSLIVGLADDLLLSPLVESGLLLIPIEILRRISVRRAVVPWIAALPWALLHWQSAGTVYGLVQFWPFVCFGIVLLATPGSRDRRWMMASAVHVVNNAIGMTAAALLSYW